MPGEVSVFSGLPDPVPSSISSLQLGRCPQSLHPSIQKTVYIARKLRPPSACAGTGRSQCEGLVSQSILLTQLLICCTSTFLLPNWRLQICIGFPGSS